MKTKNLSRDVILQKAHFVSSLKGLEGLSIGSLAEQVQMSKSGLFGHFGSRELLQVAVIDEIAVRFRQKVVEPVEALSDPVARLEACVKLWLDWSVDGMNPGGCPLAAAAFEYDAVEGAVRQRLTQIYKKLWMFLARLVLAVERQNGQAEISADVAVSQIFGLYFAFHLSHWLLAQDNARAVAEANLTAILSHMRAQIA